MNTNQQWMFLGVFFLLFFSVCGAIDDNKKREMDEYSKMRFEQRVLIADGGGVRGVIALRGLIHIQKLLSKQLRTKIRGYEALGLSTDYRQAQRHLAQGYRALLDDDAVQPNFDDKLVRLDKIFGTIGGTSTGAIVAAGLAIGKAPSDLEEIYMEKAYTIFPKMRWPDTGNFFQDLKSCAWLPLKNTFSRIGSRLTFGWGAECTCDTNCAWSAICLGLGISIGEPMACLDNAANCCAGSFECCSKRCAKITCSFCSYPLVRLADTGECVCTSVHKVTGLFPQLCYPVYHAGSLEAELKQVLEAETFDTLKARGQPKLQITAYDLTDDRLVYFNATESGPVPIWEAVRASSAAPTYFEGKVLTTTQPSHVVVDGGVSDNSPLLAALGLRSQHTADEFFKNVLVVSVGTGRQYRDQSALVSSGLLRLIKPLLSMAMDGLGESMNKHLEKVLSPRMFRFQPGELPEDLMGLDAPENVHSLKNFAQQYLKDDEIHEQMRRLLSELPGGEEYEKPLLNKFPSATLEDVV